MNDTVGDGTVDSEGDDLFLTSGNELMGRDGRLFEEHTPQRLDTGQDSRCYQRAKDLLHKFPRPRLCLPIDLSQDRLKEISTILALDRTVVQAEDLRESVQSDVVGQSSESVLV